MLQKIELHQLLRPGGVATDAYECAVEKLAVGLSRDRVCVLSVPEPQRSAFRLTLLGLPAELEPHIVGEVVESPGSCTLQLRAGVTRRRRLEVAFEYLEATARAVLGALCRSHLLRLRGDAFSSVLDDLPIPRSQQGSSLMTLQQSVDNFEERSSEGAAPIFPDPQEEVCDRGLLSLFLAREARDPEKGQLSVMQVKDASGSWQDVVLSPGEVAVLLGLTMQHATAGVLTPGTYRVAGDPYAAGSDEGTSRQLVHFELRPRPAAVLDLQQQLEAAGHQVPTKYSGPTTVASLMERFEALMSPGKHVQMPQNMEGVVLHAAWQKGSGKTSGRKRSSSDLAAMAVDGECAEEEEEAQPVTRSGAVRRTSGGFMVNQQRPSLFKEQAAAAAGAAGGEPGAARQQPGGGSGSCGSRPGSSAGAGPSSAGSSGSRQPGSAGCGSGGGRSVAEALRRRRASAGEAGGSSGGTLYHVRGRTTIVLDGCLQDDPSECITLCVRSFTGVERWFYLNRSSTRCGRVFEAWCDRMGVPLGAVKFLYQGNRAFGADTPADLQVADGEELVAVPESSDRLQQARELGSLYETLFAESPGGEDSPL